LSAKTERRYQGKERGADFVVEIDIKFER